MGGWVGQAEQAAIPPPARPVTLSRGLPPPSPTPQLQLLPPSLPVQCTASQCHDTTSRSGVTSDTASPDLGQLIVANKSQGGLPGEGGRGGRDASEGGGGYAPPPPGRPAYAQPLSP